MKIDDEAICFPLGGLAETLRELREMEQGSKGNNERNDDAKREIDT